MGLGALAIRLADLQIVEADRYRDLASANQWNFRLIPPPRGRILDRNGVVLADNRPSFRLLVIRDETKDLDDTLNSVARLIPATASRRPQLIKEINESPHAVPVAVATDLTWEEFARVNLHADELPGVECDMNEARYYPFPGAFAHVIGYVAKVSDADVAAYRTGPQRRGRPDAAEPGLPDRQAGRGEGARRRAHRQARRAQGRSRRARPGGGRRPRRRPCADRPARRWC